MALETATYISDLVSTNPAASDNISQGDDHLRLLKATIKATFPNITGEVTPTHTKINDLATVTGTETLTNKTLTTPVLSGTASGTTAGRLGYLSGALSYGNGTVQRTVVNLDEAQTLSNKTLTSGTINSTTIGATTASTGKFSTLETTGNFLLNGAAGTSGQVLVSAGSGAVPTWKSAPSAGPAFSAQMNGAQTVSQGVLTKVQYSNENFDTNNNYDPVTNYRFTPTVAGYYQLNASMFAQGSTSTNGITSYLYKNGALFAGLGGANGATGVCGSTIVYANGTTDYFEVYARVYGTGTMTFSYSGSAEFFTGSLVRAA